MITIAILRSAGVSEAMIKRIQELEKEEEITSGRAMEREKKRRQRAEKFLNKINDRVPQKSGDTKLQYATERATDGKAWYPDRNGVDLAALRGVTGPALDIEVARFKSYYAARGRSFVDWNNAWKSWVLSPWFNKADGQTKNGNRSSYIAEWRRTLDQLQTAALLADGEPPAPTV